MPIYEFKCEVCGCVTEELLNNRSTDDFFFFRTCSGCGKRTVQSRIISSSFIKIGREDSLR